MEQGVQLMIGAVAEIDRAAAEEKYGDFVEKFKPSKTTDDCYTPEPVMAAVNAWVAREYALDPATFVRPFWPGGDYQAFDYAPDAVVVDNPPFSILGQIVDFYLQENVRFFLFSPGLTCLNVLRKHLGRVCCICTGAGIIYENGADVNTSFVTSLDRRAARSAPDLHDAVEAAAAEYRREFVRELPKYKYPAEVLTAAALNYMSAHGTALSVSPESAAFVRVLDAQKPAGKAIFGGGLLLADRAAADRAAAVEWKLSEREWQIISRLE